ncbi:MAG: energy-coupling factor transporter ATPase [Peptococcaceae bacterium]|nr:energy-coupling factor transporter ATPase [Peptococcaceae bacterium]
MSLELQNVSYIYNAGGLEETKALHDVSLTVPDHSFVGLVGHTGSGKSTLVQLMNGLLKPTMGRVIVDGFDLADKSKEVRERRKQVGLVFQYPEYQLFEETIAKDIAFGPKNQGLNEEEQRERVQEAMALVDLEYDVWKDRSPFELSGGQKRRVAIAGIVAMRPRYLILDEPTAGLDPLGRDRILEAIHSLYMKSDMSIILVSHSMDDVARFANYMIVMNQGTKVTEGTTEEVFAQADLLERIHLGIPSSMALLRALNKHGFNVPTNALTVDEAYRIIENALAKREGDTSC